MNQTLLRLIVCLLAAATACLTAQGQQPLPTQYGRPAYTPRSANPPPAGNVIPRPVPQLTGAVEPSLTNPFPPARTSQPSNFRPQYSAFQRQPTPIGYGRGQLPQPTNPAPQFGDPRRGQFAPATDPRGILPDPSQFMGPGGLQSGVNEPVDPITGLPLRLTSRDRSNPLLPLKLQPQPQPGFHYDTQPGFMQTGQTPSLPVPLPPLHQNWNSQNDPGLSFAGPAPGAIANPQMAPGPILFQGRIESLGDDRIAQGDFDWGSLDAPIPQIDPPLPEFGNGDGELDLYDILEEYGGRFTHGGISTEPHLKHPDQRSWLRIEDWRNEITWLAGTDDDLGIASARGSIGIGLAKLKGVILRPTVAAYFLSGPNQTDLPSRVYDAELEATWMHRFNDRFRMHVSARGGVYSDFNTSEDFEKALRVSGTGIGAFEVNPDLQLVLGVAYFNLGDVWAWPVAGVVYQPTDEIRLELLFPEARISALINENEFFTERAYLGAKFFGRTWQVDRTIGMRDRVTYSDWRITAGHEIRYVYGISTFVEFGYAFNRELEYRSGVGDYDPEGVALISGGIFY